jgi:hypothetical protein
MNLQFLAIGYARSAVVIENSVLTTQAKGSIDLHYAAILRSLNF